MTEQKKSKISEHPGTDNLNTDTGNLHEPVSQVIDYGELPPVNDSISKDSNDSR
jgi:hypothetical protein